MAGNVLPREHRHQYAVDGKPGCHVCVDNGFVRDVDLANIATTASFNDLVNVPAGLADGDDLLQRAAGSGLMLGGNALNLDTTGCVAGEVLKRMQPTMAGSVSQMQARFRAHRK